MCPERQSIHICGHVTCDHVARARCSPTKWFSNEFNRNYKNKFIAPAAAAGGGEDGGEDGGEVPARHLKRRKTSAAGFFGEDDDEAGPDEEVPEEDELKAYLAFCPRSSTSPRRMPPTGGKSTRPSSQTWPSWLGST